MLSNIHFVTTWIIDNIQPQLPSPTLQPTEMFEIQHSTSPSNAFDHQTLQNETNELDMISTMCNQSAASIHFNEMLAVNPQQFMAQNQIQHEAMPSLNQSKQVAMQIQNIAGEMAAERKKAETQFDILIDVSYIVLHNPKKISKPYINFFSYFFQNAMYSTNWYCKQKS